MRPPEPPTILACGHVEIEPGRCATIGCDGIHPSWHWTLPKEFQNDPD